MINHPTRSKATKNAVPEITRGVVEKMNSEEKDELTKRAKKAEWWDA